VTGCDQEQKRRYIEIKQSDLPMSVAAKRTREFRCPPQEQVIFLMICFALLLHSYTLVFFGVEEFLKLVNV